MSESTVLEDEAREELISNIDEHVSVCFGACDFLREKFGIKNGKELQSLPFSKLFEIADFFDNQCYVPA